MPPRGVTICRGVAVFLHRAIVMQAKVGSQSHSLTSAGHCGCKCGLIVLHGGTRRGKTNPIGLDREGFTGSLVFVSFSSSGFFLNMSTFSLPLLFFSVWVSDCCQTRRMTQRDVHSLYTHRHAHSHTRTHTHTHTHTHTLVMDCSTCTECWRSKRGGKGLFSSIGPRGCKARCPSYIWGLGVFCPCAVTVSHTNPPSPCAVAVTSPTTPYTQAPAPMNAHITGRAPASGGDT